MASVNQFVIYLKTPGLIANTVDNVQQEELLFTLICHLPPIYTPQTGWHITCII